MTFLSSHFDRTALPPPQSFYEKELGRITRPSRGWVRGRCPFHESKSGLSFSVNLNEGNFYCFGCGVKGGDVLKFVMLRDKMSFKQAAQSLGAWRNVMTPEESHAIRSRQEERERRQGAEFEQKESARLERIAAREHLHAVATLYREACTEHEWQLMSELLPRVRQFEERYAHQAGLELPYEY